MMYICVHVLLRYVGSCETEAHRQCAEKLVENFRCMYDGAPGFAHCYTQLCGALQVVRVALMAQWLG